MPSMRLGAKGKKDPKADEKKYPVTVSHGLHLIIGPTGSGKSLLQKHFAYQFVDGICHLCPPGGPSGCFEKGGLPFEIFATDRGPKVMRWAKPLESLDQLETDDSHKVIMFDEGFMWSDARRSMGGSNLIFGTLISQARKGGNRIYYTSQTMRKVDVRLRDDSKFTWNVWNKDQQGLIVGAVLHTGADGSLEPWNRGRVKPRVMRFNTQATRDLYDSWETIDKDSLSIGDEAYTDIIPVVDDHGEIKKLDLNGFIEKCVERLLREGVENSGMDGLYIHPDEIVELCNELVDMRPPIPARAVRDTMQKNGWMLDGNKGYWIGTKGHWIGRETQEVPA